MNKHKHVIRKLALVPIFVVGVGSLLGTAHEDDPEIVSVDEIYYSAFRSPETFDADLPSLVKDDRSADCLRRLRDQALNEENQKLLECGQLITGSNAWNECHTEAESHGNRAAIMNDIANAIEGPTRFDETQGYAFLILSKMALTEIEWNEFINLLQSVTPEFKCEY